MVISGGWSVLMASVLVVDPIGGDVVATMEVLFTSDWITVVLMACCTTFDTVAGRPTGVTSEGLVVVMVVTGLLDMPPCNEFEARSCASPTV